MADSIEFTLNTNGRGPRGYSAYAIAVQNGFEGTEAEWLESLEASVTNTNVNTALAADAPASQTAMGIPDLLALKADSNLSNVNPATGKDALGVPVINVVTDHGADHTGATSCTAAVLAAVTAAESSTLTRTVYFPPGTYKFNVDLPEGVMVMGAGTALQADSPSSQHQTICIPADDALPCFWVKYGTGQEIKRMSFEGNGNGTSVAAIKIMTASGVGYGGMGVVLDHLWISGFTRGIDTKNANMLQFRSVSFTGCGHGAYLTSTDTTIFDNCSFWDNDTLGVYGNQSRGVVIRGGDHGQQAVPLFKFENGGSVEICNIHVEGMTGSHVIEVANTELNVHDCSWLDQSGVATTAWVRKTYFQFGCTIGRIFTSGVPAHTGTDYPLIFETEDSSCPPPDVIGMNGAIRWTTDNTYAADREVDTTVRWGTLSRPADEIRDEFLGGKVDTSLDPDSIPSGQVGELGWTYYDWTGTNGSVTRIASAAPNLGVVRVTSGSSTNNSRQLYFGDSFSDVTNFATGALHVPWEQRWAVTIPTATSITVHVGWMGGNVTTFDRPDNFIGWTFNTADSSNWRAYARASNVSTSFYDSGVAGSTSRVTLRIRCIKAGQVRFSINDGPEGVITSGLPAGSMTFGALVLTRTAAARSLDLDYFRFRQLMTNR